MDFVDGIVHANYLGQDAGAVIAEIIHGRVDLSGKLPTTWSQSLADTATFEILHVTNDANGKLEPKLEEGITAGH